VIGVGGGSETLGPVGRLSFRKTARKQFFTFKIEFKPYREKAMVWEPWLFFV
jgi:hypothetical protein